MTVALPATSRPTLPGGTVVLVPVREELWVATLVDCQVNPPSVRRVDGDGGGMESGEADGSAAVAGGVAEAVLGGAPPQHPPPRLHHQALRLLDRSQWPHHQLHHRNVHFWHLKRGRKPDSFYRIKDPEARRFVGRCLESAPNRVPAEELLLDLFLDCDDGLPTYLPGRPSSGKSTPASPRSAPTPAPVCKAARTPISPTSKPQKIVPASTDMTITGKLNPDDDTIILKVQIADKDGCIRNLCFPFDIVKDTPMEVAIEMVKELEISDRDPSDIAQVIESEISGLIPDWKDVAPTGDNDSFVFEDEDSAVDLDCDSPSFSDFREQSGRLFFDQLPSEISTDERRPSAGDNKNNLNGRPQDESCDDEDEDKSSYGSTSSGRYANWTRSSSEKDLCAGIGNGQGQLGLCDIYPLMANRELTGHGWTSRFCPDVVHPIRKCNSAKAADPLAGSGQWRASLAITGRRRCGH